MSEIKGYHAHVYYNAETKAKAAALRETIARQVQGRSRRFQRRAAAARTRSRSSTSSSRRRSSRTSCRG